MAISALFIVPLIILPIFWGIGRWVLRPLREAAKEPTPKTQYQLADLLILIGQLALLGVLFFGSGGGRVSENLVPMIICWCYVLWIWWLGVRALSRANVPLGLRREAVLLFGVPAAYVVAPILFFFPLLGMFVARAASDAPDPWYLHPLAILGFWLAACVIVVMLCRALARWAVHESNDAPATGWQKGLFATGSILLVVSALAWHPIHAWHLRNRALNTEDVDAVYQMSRRGMQKEVVELLTEAKEPRVRSRAASLLTQPMVDGKNGLDPVIVRALVHAATSDPDDEVRRIVLENVGYGCRAVNFTGGTHANGKPWTKAEIEDRNQAHRKRRNHLCRMVVEALDDAALEKLTARLSDPSQPENAPSTGQLLISLLDSDAGEALKGRLQPIMERLPAATPKTHPDHTDWAYMEVMKKVTDQDTEKNP